MERTVEQASASQGNRMDGELADERALRGERPPAPAERSTCECGYPWFDHDDRGCGVDSFLSGPCPCRLTGPVR